MIKLHQMRLFRIILVSMFLLPIAPRVKADGLTMILELEGTWKFSIGDNPEWSDPNFDDSNWESVYVPGSWESQGFENYNGFAWYRKSFTYSQKNYDNYVYLTLGFIDDADEVYLNGKLIGNMGHFSPFVQTAHDVLRQYAVPIEMLNKSGKNTIAVRVYDNYNIGGIVSGPIGIFAEKENELIDIDLSGYWHFETEAELKVRVSKGEKINPEKQIFVPGYWENSGYAQYNGKARYKTTFSINKKSAEDLYLILGFIDDIEVVYLNGEKIGSIIATEKEQKTRLPFDVIFRGYQIPPELLNYNKENTISIVVYDKGGLGGIYRGPIGITTEENYTLLKKMYKDKSRRTNTIFGSFWY